MKARLIKYFTREALVQANEEAIGAHAKQAIARETLAALPPDVKIPVHQYHPLSLTRYRVVLSMNANGDVALLDCQRATIDRLPTLPVVVKLDA
jgi:hypothetical protein